MLPFVRTFDGRSLDGYGTRANCALGGLLSLSERNGRSAQHKTGSLLTAAGVGL